jgi:vacuolar-type H+-ATPase subunit H
VSIEAILQVNQAENSAVERKTTATNQAKQILRDAETAGELLLEQTRARAAAQVREALAEAEKRAAVRSAEVLRANESDCKTLSDAAREKLPDAAALVIKRIVNI